MPTKLLVCLCPLYPVFKCPFCCICPASFDPFQQHLEAWLENFNHMLEKKGEKQDRVLYSKIINFEGVGADGAASLRPPDHP